jgi:hypothetical protein
MVSEIGEGKGQAEIECSTGPKTRIPILMKPLPRSECLETEFASRESELLSNEIGSLVEKDTHRFREHMEGVNKFLYVHSALVSLLRGAI